MTKNNTNWQSALAIGLWLASVLSAPVLSVANAAEPKPGDIIENSIKMKLVYVPPAEFEMGSPESEGERRNDETLHHVKLTQGFCLGSHEVTQSQFERVLGRNPSWFSKEGGGKAKVVGLETGSFPVEMVSWYDAVEFCNALSKSEGLPEYYKLLNVSRKDDVIQSAEVAENGGNGYRLPTEAEWEYACRAGSKTPFHFGEALNGKEANVSGSFPYGTLTKGPDLSRTCAVGSYPASAFGLFDMHGNVWEWCQDWHDKYGGDAVDPKGAHVGETRQLRGGSFRNGALAARSAKRYGLLPTAPLQNIGFRVARTYP